MFVKRSTVRGDKRTYEYLSLVEAFRDEAGVSRNRTLFRLGEVSKLKASGELDRIVEALSAHARGQWVEADALAAEEAPAIGPLAAIEVVWGQLGLTGFFEEVAAEAGLSWSLADAVFAMVANRLCDPASKRKTHRWIQAAVVAPDGFSYPELSCYYRALDYLEAAKEELEAHLYGRLCDLANLDLTLVCYDLTSTYFEGAAGPSEVFPSKAFGHSRDRRGDRPQVVVGLLTTREGVPIAHHVFAGNTADVTTLPTILEDLQERFAVGRVCVVGDRGLMSRANLEAIQEAGCEWVVATRLHRDRQVAAALHSAAQAEAEAWAEVERFHSRVCDVEVDGQRYVVVFSPVRQRRDVTRRLQLMATTEDKLLKVEARVRRGDLVDKAAIAAAAQRAVDGPVRRLFDLSDLDEARFVYDYDEQALAYDELLAGHYLLSTSLDHRQAEAGEVLACYRSLQEVEVRFRVLKDFLALRPVYHWTESRVRGHIAVCVLAATIEALLGQALARADVRDPDLEDQTITARRALEELHQVRQVTLTAEGTTIQAVTTRSPLQAQILKACGVDTSAWKKPHIHPA